MLKEIKYFIFIQNNWRWWKLIHKYHKDNPANKEVLELYLETSKNLLEMVKNQNYDEFKSNFNDNREYLKNHISDMIEQSNFLIDKMAEFKKGSKSE